MVESGQGWLQNPLGRVQLPSSVKRTRSVPDRLVLARRVGACSGKDRLGVVRQSRQGMDRCVLLRCVALGSGSQGYGIAWSVTVCWGTAWYGMAVKAS